MSAQKVATQPLNRQDFEEQALSVLRNAETNAKLLAEGLVEWEGKFSFDMRWGHGFPGHVAHSIFDDNIMLNGEPTRAIGIMESGATRGLTRISLLDGKLWCRTGTKTHPVRVAGQTVSHGEEPIYCSWRFHLLDKMDERLWAAMLEDANNRIAGCLSFFGRASSLG